MNLNRRNFIKLSAVSGLFAAGATQVKPALTAFSATDSKASAASGEWKSSTCQGCTTWCPVQVYVVDGRAIKVQGNPHSKANHGKVCPRAHLALQQVYDPDRVKQPMKRTNKKKGRNEDPKFVAISWEEAIDTITDKMMALREKQETHKLAVLRGRYTYLRDLIYTAVPKIFGSPNGISHSSICAEAEKFGAYYTEAMWDYRDYDHNNSRYEIFWGADPISSNRQVPHTINIWGNLTDRAKVAVIDPRLSASAAKADEWLPVIPGQDGALAVAMAHVILTEGLWYKPFVGDFADGVNKFVEGKTVKPEDFTEIEGHGVVQWWNLALKDATPEWASEKAGIPVEQIIRVATDFAKAAPNCISFLAPGASMQVRGAYTAMATHALNGLVGSADNVGGTIGKEKTPDSKIPDYKEFQDEIAKKGSKMEKLTRNGRLEYAGLNKKSGGTTMTDVVATSILSEDPYLPEVVIGYWCNFNFSCGGANRWDEALAKLPFFVHLTVNPAEMTHFADIVLPCGHQMFERWGFTKSKGNGYTNMSLEQPVIETVWDTKVDESEIPFLIAESLAKKGFPNLLDFYKSIKDPETGKSAETAYEFNMVATRNLTHGAWDPKKEKKGDNIKGWDEFLRLGVWNSIHYRYKQKWGRNWGTDSGGFEFYSETLKRVLGEHADKNKVSIDKVLEASNYTAKGELGFVPHYEEPYRHGDEDKNEYPFIFSEHRSRLNREARSANNSWYQSFKDADPGDVAWGDVLKVNPIDAKKLGVKDGDKVKITSPAGTITVDVKLWEGTRPGVVSKCYGQGHWAYGHIAALDFDKKIARGGNNNIILPADYERLSGSQARHGGPTRVKVEKV